MLSAQFEVGMHLEALAFKSNIPLGSNMQAHNQFSPSILACEQRS